VFTVPAACCQLTARFDAVDVPPSQVNILNGNALDLIGECKAFEERIKSYGGVELFLGGIGEDGHIAFNEPGARFAVASGYDTV
jgi:glucosamine-6-phosphate deaminase